MPRFQFSLRALLIVTFAASMILAAECSAWWVRFPATCAAWSAIGSLVGLAFGTAEDYAAKGAAIGIFAFLFRCIWLAARIET